MQQQKNNDKDIFNYQAVFFDLDGTLIDSAQDLFVAINVMCEQLGIKQAELSQIKNWIGNGTLKLVERTLVHVNGTQADEKLLHQAFHIFSKAYRDCVGEHSCLYAGVQNLLVKLLSRQIKLACITNKPLEFTDFLLQQNRISQYFSLICAGDTVKHKKPHPWPLLHASEVFQVSISDCLMIGDSQHDIAAAKSAGCDVFAVSYGYNHGEDIQQYQPNRVIDGFNQWL